MSYADITFLDKNPIKRWLQAKRLVSAMNLCSHLSREPEVICDFGAGNGELIKLLAIRYPNAKLICYEPTPSLLEEARNNLSDIAKVEFYQDITGVALDCVDVVFCLEVFEHLPPDETYDALRKMYDVLKRKGVLIIGTPVEIGIPALYKGMFRMLRRYGSFDATIKNVWLSFLKRPPSERPCSEIAPQFKFHFEHMGFDFRRLKQIISMHFRLREMSTSPISWVGTWIMPEVYFVAEKTSHGRSPSP